MPWQKELLHLGEASYRAFYIRLLPGFPEDRIIGVRMPRLRAYAKEMEKRGLREDFLKHLPHDFYEENLLHDIFLSGEKDVERVFTRVDAFLPYVDNWAVCDSLRPRIFSRHHAELLPWVEKWMASEKPFVCRFGVEMLMLHFLGEDFQASMPQRVAGIRSKCYYVNMIVAWYFATALALREESVWEYFEGDAMDPVCRGLAIRKALESRRCTAAQKKRLRALKNRDFAQNG